MTACAIAYALKDKLTADENEDRHAELVARIARQVLSDLDIVLRSKIQGRDRLWGWQITYGTRVVCDVKCQFASAMEAARDAQGEAESFADAQAERKATP
jgi:hypothetical protein